MIYKSYLLENNLKDIFKHNFFLFYGENLGLLKDFKNKIINENKLKEIVSLYSGEVLKDKEILLKEIKNKSLFYDEKIIFLNNANDKVLEIFENIIDEKNSVKVLLFAENLEKKSKLRKFFEKQKLVGITACYQDNEIGIRKIILNELKDFKNLSNEVINYIIKVTSLDRGKVYNEIQKIKTFFQDKTIKINDLDRLLNITVNEDFSKLRDEALNGEKQKTNKLLADTTFNSEEIIYYLNTLNQRITKLQEIDRLKELNIKSNIEEIISSLKPPIFWKEKPAILKQSKKWNKNKLKMAFNKIYKIELRLKSDSSVNKDLLIKNLIIELCCSANHS